MSDNAEPLIDGFTRQVKGATNRLRDGDIPVLSWQTKMREDLGSFSVAAWCHGADTDTFDSTAASRLIEHLAFQLKHLDEFALEIEAAPDWEAGWDNRAESYAKSIKVPYWQGRTNLLPLPAMPAQGTQCMNNCGCIWRIEVIDEEAGDYDCYWELGKDDNCQTCQTRATTWAPYQIRGMGYLAPIPSTSIYPPSITLSDRLSYKGSVPKGVKNIVGQLEQIHKIPESMTRTQVGMGDALDMGIGTLGQYGYYGEEGIEVFGSLIKVAKLTEKDTYAGTLWHELGHYFDRQGLFGDNRRYFSESKDPRALGFLDTVYQTQNWQTLVNAPTTRFTSKYHEYLTQKKEVWARAYSQYIATKTRDGVTLDLYYENAKRPMPMQWSQEDFEPIERFLDQMFAEQGLLL